MQGMVTGKITLLVLLDLSVTFDTIDQGKFLMRLKYHIGVDGVALKWFRSYLLRRRQLAFINDAVSNESYLEYGLPQGSVIRPSSFSMNTLPLGDIIHIQDIQYHCYADDTQIYVSVNPLQE